jgi:hypothetical protein
MIWPFERYLKKGDLVLNVGSGNCERARDQLSDYDVINLDIWPTGGPDIIADGAVLPFANKTFDGIFCFDVIEHLDEERGLLLLNEMERVCRKCIFILTPAIWTDNVKETILLKDPAYRCNPYNYHRHLWKERDFTGRAYITWKTDGAIWCGYKTF